MSNTNPTPILPKKLQPGSHIRIIAPSRSLSLLSQETIEIASGRLSKMGFKLSFGKYVNESDDFMSTSIEHRIEDLHEAFSDQSIDGILTVIGGFNSNQLLKYIDWDIIKNNPKVFCGYSDITILNNSIFAKTGLISYSGPHYSSFGQKLDFDYTQEYFERAVVSDESFEVVASPTWSDDFWWKDQDDRQIFKNSGFVVINEGSAQGIALGANLGTLNLLQGSEFMPDLEGSMVFIEDDELTFPAEFDRDLQSLIYQSGFGGVRALIIGRFQKVSKVSLELLTQIIKTKKELEGIPVVAGVDFGHTDPKITIPIGGNVSVIAKGDEAKIVFER